MDPHRADPYTDMETKTRNSNYACGLTANETISIRTGAYMN